jgi:hypothetical protein
MKTIDNFAKINVEAVKVLKYCRSQKILQSECVPSFTCKIGFDKAEDDPSKVRFSYFLIPKVDTSRRKEEE